MILEVQTMVLDVQTMVLEVQIMDLDVQTMVLEVQTMDLEVQTMDLDVQTVVLEVRTTPQTSPQSIQKHGSRLDLHGKAWVCMIWQGRLGTMEKHGFVKDFRNSHGSRIDFSAAAAPYRDL